MTAIEKITNINTHKQLCKMYIECLNEMSVYSSPTPEIQGVNCPPGIQYKSRVEEYIIQRDKLTHQYLDKISQYLEAIKIGMSLIEKAPDEKARPMLYYRYVKNMSWGNVAKFIGDGVTTDAVEKRCERCLKIITELDCQGKL